MLLDTPDPAMDPDLNPYAYDAQIRHLLATYMPLRPEGQLALLGAWLIDHQDQQRAALDDDEATGSAQDPAFVLLRTIVDRVVEQVIGYNAELGDRASRSQAMVEHHRSVEQAAALGPRVAAAAHDENDLGPDVMAWVVASRARRAAELAATTTATDAATTTAADA